MPMRGELPIVTARSRRPASTAEIAWSQLLAIISNHDLKLIAAFCTIGYLITINAIIRFPDFGATMAALATLP